LSGDGWAFGELVRRYEVLLLKVLRRYARTPDETRDLVQRAFLQAFEAARRALPRLERDNGEVPFKAWLLRIAINLGKNHLRDTSRWTTVPLDAVGGQRAEGASAAEQLERAQDEAAVRRAWARWRRRGCCGGSGPTWRRGRRRRWSRWQWTRATRSRCGWKRRWCRTCRATRFSRRTTRCLSRCPGLE
jgi:RNA polymerase sigma factor (sigma-70 family)